MSAEAVAAAHKRQSRWKGEHMERRTFDSWQDFFTYMEVYQKRSNQVFTRRTATSVKTRNHVLAAMVASGRKPPTAMLPERFLDYTRMLQCPHKRVESPNAQSENACPRVHWNGVQTSDCQARVVATLQLGQRGVYQVHVTKLDLEHNHPLDADNAITTASSVDATATPSSTTRAPVTAPATMPRVPTSAPPKPKRRRLSDPPVARSESVLLNHATTATANPNLGAQVSHVPTMADVRSFLQHAKRVGSYHRGAGQSVEERLAAYVNEAAAQDGNVAKIFVDDQKVLSSITLQTKHMRKVFEAFPEVLRVESCTARNNGASESSYGVFSLMAHDAFGNWQYVQHAIVENDNAETLRAALQQFKTHNPRHDRVSALMVDDGDAPELHELCACFPAARVLLSQFHVVRALHEAIAKDDRELSSWHKDRLTGIAQLLVYASTPLVYASNIAIMADVLGSKEHPFFCWFLEKWDAWRDRWTSFAREGVTTFCISESGDKFSSTWKTIFTAAKSDLALDETVAAIRYFQAVVERTFMLELNRAVNETDVSSAPDGKTDPELRILATTVSPAAYNLVAPQYRYATTRARFQFCEPSRGTFFISAVELNDAFCDDPSKEFCVEAERGWSCSCAFMVNHHLPCRHVFYIRRIVRCSYVIPLAELEPRWVLAKVQRFFDVQRLEASERGVHDEAGLDTQAAAARQRPLVAYPGSWQKFSAALDVGKRISQRMMEMDTQEFDHAIRFYQLVEKTMNMRPFALNRATIARVDAHAHANANARSQWAVNGGVPARTVCNSLDDVKAVVTSRTNALRVPAAAPVAPVTAAAAAATVAAMAMETTATTASKPHEVIDLQDESETEEEDVGKEKGTGKQTEGGRSAGDKNSHGSGKENANETEPEPEGASSAEVSMEEEQQEDKWNQNEDKWESEDKRAAGSSPADRRISRSWGSSPRETVHVDQHKNNEEEHHREFEGNVRSEEENVDPEEIV